MMCTRMKPFFRRGMNSQGKQSNIATRIRDNDVMTCRVVIESIRREREREVFLAAAVLMESELVYHGKS